MLIAETAALLPAKYLPSKPKKPKWDVRDNLFFHQKQLQLQKKMKNKSKLRDTGLINNILSSNEIDMEGYQSDQPATNLE